MPEWAEIFAMAYPDGEWKVGAEIASMVSHSIWHCAMLLEDYDLAEETMARCLRHPGPFGRHAQAEGPIRLQVARWVRDRDARSANALIELVNCGTYRPGVMARSIYHTLSLWIEPHWTGGPGSERPVTDEARLLALALAVALRAGKRHQRASTDIDRWDAFGRHIAISAGFSPVEG